jgi:hypothetical protein
MGQARARWRKTHPQQVRRERAKHMVHWWNTTTHSRHAVIIGADRPDYLDSAFEESSKALTETQTVCLLKKEIGHDMHNFSTMAVKYPNGQAFRIIEMGYLNQV